jgi:hypothetical protein
MTDVEYARAFFEKDYYATETTGIVIEAVSEEEKLLQERARSLPRG